MAREAKWDIYIVRYEAVNAVLLNAFPIAHRTLGEQQATIGRSAKANRTVNCNGADRTDCNDDENNAPRLSTRSVVIFLLFLKLQT